MSAVVSATLAVRKRLKEERENEKPRPQLKRTNALHVAHVDPHDESRAAHIIGRAYRRAKMGALVHRSVLLDRVELEESLCAGVVRLILFVFLFVFLIIANTGKGITSEHKRHISTLMNQTLDLEYFLKIKSLDGAREYLPHLSKRLKQFSMASSSRFQDNEETAIQILGPRTNFNAPLRVLGLNPSVGRGDFTVSAWVETKTGARARENLMRMPLATNVELSCWAWAHPSELRFGAHDFYSTEEEPEAWEEVVKVGGALPPGLTHEVVILRNATLTFFRNAEPVAAVQLRREMTECLTPGVFELGDRGVAMSSVKFYPRALLVGEVQEIFFGGQPLSELATGTVLEQVELDTTEAIKVAIQGGTSEVTAAVDATRHASSVDSVIEIATTAQLSLPPFVEQLYIEDEAPAPVHWQNDPALLSARNLKIWEEAGRPANLSAVLTEKWMGEGALRHWSFFEDPVYGARLPPEVNPDQRVDPPLTNEGPEWGDDVTGLTFSYWLQPQEADKMFWCDVSFRRGGEPEGDDFVDHIQLTNYGHVLWLDFRRKWGPERYGPWKFLTFLDKETGSIEERFIFTKYVSKPGPAAWRHVSFTVDFTSGRILLYFDGRLFADSTIEEPGDPFGINYEPFPASWTKEVLSKLRVHTFSGTLSDWGGCKVAQARVYPRVLSEEEVQQVQNAARWGGGGRVKQCADMASDFDFVDTPEVDDRLRSCAWYHQTRKTNPEVCLSARARAQCPLSCQGRRACYDGSLFEQRARGKVAKVHTVFSHIKHIKPRNRTVICPASSVDRASLLARCRADRADSAPIEPGEYAYPGQYIFDQIQRPDLRDCEQLLGVVDEEQCAWDSSWVPEFLEELRERREMSISFWMRPKEGSFGMPKNFFPSFHMYSRLHRPYTLLEGSESFPLFEPLWRFFFNAAGRRNDRLLVVSNHIPYAKAWTYVHFQMKRKESDDGWNLCGALSAMAATCIDLDDDQGGYNLYDGLGWPAEFLEGIEFTTEMLVSPIEVQAKAFTPAQIQQRYYTRRDRMEKILGPVTTSPPTGATEEVRKFDNRAALVTPPLVFQSRAEAVVCNESTTRAVLRSQLDVVKAAHCQAPGTCPGVSVDAMATCLGGESTESYFGLTPFRFRGSAGVCDYLYTLADSDVVVRDGRTLPTFTFLDGKTTSFVVLVVFHVPNNGMSTLLELRGVTSGFAVQTEVNFFHYGYLPKSEHGALIERYIAVFVVLFLIAALNIALVFKMLRERQRWHLPLERGHVMGVIYDVLQAAAVAVFSVTSLVDKLDSEQQASEVLSKLSDVPFASPDVSFQAKLSTFFAAADELYLALDAERQRTAFAFAIMVLMLLRIIRATSAHPRTGVLTGTLARGLNDLYHFALQFMVIFFFFSYAATWLFSDTREEFRDLAMSMESQFQIMLGNLPPDFSTDYWLIIYVVLCSITLFLLMLNFLLALVVDAYMSVREEIVRNEAENEFFYDVTLTMIGWYKSQREGWPSLRAVAHLLRKKIASRRITAVHFVLQGVDLESAKLMIEHYHQLDAVRAPRPVLMHKQPASAKTAIGTTSHEHSDGNGNGSVEAAAEHQNGNGKSNAEMAHGESAGDHSHLHPHLHPHPDHGHGGAPHSSDLAHLQGEGHHENAHPGTRRRRVSHSQAEVTISAPLIVLPEERRRSSEVPNLQVYGGVPAPTPLAPAVLADAQREPEGAAVS